MAPKKNNDKSKARAAKPAASRTTRSKKNELRSSPIQDVARVEAESKPTHPRQPTKTQESKSKNTKATLTSGGSTDKVKGKRKAEDDDDEESEGPAVKRSRTGEKSAATTITSGTRAVAKAGKRKRKATEDISEEEEEEGPPAKKARKDNGAGGPPGGGRRRGKGARKGRAAPKAKETLTYAPKEFLDVYVFGANRKGELGLEQKDIREPRWNPHLSGPDPGVVQIATGSWHSVALTRDNRILTWGHNYGGALGRELPRDPNVDQGDDVEASSFEYIPAEIPLADFTVLDDDARPKPAGVPVFTQVAAGNMFSFALTDDGYIYGWGTFRVSPPFASVCPPRANKQPDLRRQDWLFGTRGPQGP
jgi:regulator of chromosome condensation